MALERDFPGGRGEAGRMSMSNELFRFDTIAIIAPSEEEFWKWWPAIKRAIDAIEVVKK